MLSRSLSRGRFIVLFIVSLLLVSMVYFYVHNLKENYESSQSEDSCDSELIAIRYQLSVVAEYKYRIDRQLTETQKSHEADKERFKDIMESCIVMKQQTAICQSQFEDLQGECKKVREEYDSIRKN